MSAKSTPQAAGKVKLPIYMDNHATTPVDPRVLEAMLPYFTEKFGNPASHSHEFGWTAEAAVEEARQQIARLIGAQAKEIVFTSGATESDNLAITGAATACREKGDHIITVATEHKAVLDTCRHLEKAGLKVTYLAVDKDGLLDLNALRNALTSKTILVSVMAANNEIGVLQPLEEIGKMCRERGVLFHSDAAQGAGKIPLNVDQLKLDLLSISGHKIYGPKGVGALYVRSQPQACVAPLIHGGGHEHGMRSGTLNVTGIVGLGKACELCAQEMNEENQRVVALRTRLKDAILGRLEDVHVNGSLERRLPGNLNLAFGHVDAEALQMGLRDVAVSSGSACSSASIAPSHVLKAI
ncbi:MAG TPA: aminotransferase class V-fold PLP-dependent enzyme, partial [Terriglobales bacterium]|nr:aminotransferase class V-fold PLP-dependent enzyme [Terriglobales bacterium]